MGFEDRVPYDHHTTARIYSDWVVANQVVQHFIIQSNFFTGLYETNTVTSSHGLLAHLVEHCTSIAEVIGSNPVQAWIFFRSYFHCCLSSVHYCEHHFHIHVFIRSSHIWFSYIHSHLFITSRVYMELTSTPSWLVSSVGRALYQYRRSHRFKSRTGLNLSIF